MKRFPLSLAFYRWLLRLYPKRFRRQFEDAMISDFEEMLVADGRMRSWRRVLVDATASVPAERERPFRCSLPSLTGGLGDELRFVVRSLAGAPLYTVVAAVTLALGIGATIAIFSLVSATLLEPPPFAAPERVVAVWQWNEDAARPNSIAPATFRDFERRSTVFAGMEPPTLAGPLRDAVTELDPDVAAVRIETMEERLASSTGSDRFRLALVGGFAVVALVLALVGLYGVVAALVGERRRDFGVRMALGARARDLLVLVLGNSARIIGFGIVAGLLAARALGRVVAPFLFDVTTSNVLTLGGTGLTLAAIALAASWIPARHAANVDLTTVLRHD